jgi:uncharacterized iron-regulated membrane protein
VLDRILHHPRQIWLRRALFQVHLWLGVLLSIYVMIIGLSGSILVFQDEVRRASMPSIQFDQGQIAGIDSVLSQTRSSYPGIRITYVGHPQDSNPWWTLYGEDTQGKPALLYAHPVTGAPYKHSRRLLIDFVLDLHVYLLAGPKGFVVNCIAGIGLLLLAITGVVLWWPGVKLWKRGFFFSLRHRWKRINYDAHNAIGIWTLLIVSWWGFTAVYFLLPDKIAAVVNSISPLVGMKEPKPSEPIAGKTVEPLTVILEAAQKVSPGVLEGVSLGQKPGDPVAVYIGRKRPGDFSHRDILTYNGHDGRLLTVWHYGDNHSAGDWFLWLMYPLHFGTLWGVQIKVLWSLLGLSLPLLSITGLIMYWNRYLSVRWRSL